MKLHKALLLFSAALLGLCVAGAATIMASPQQNPAPAQPAQRSATQANSDSLPMPASEIIRRFAENESQFKLERDNYTYSQTVLVEASTPDGRNGGKYELGSDIVFTPAGKRYEKVTYAPQSTLQLISLTPQDMQDLESIQPFVLTTAELPKYNVEFDGKERIDALDTYRFNVAPKKIEKDQRYFQGTIWVEDHDLAIVKSDGKAVPDIVTRARKIASRASSPTGKTSRPISGSRPTRAPMTPCISTPSGDVRIRMTVRYRNYKRFGATVRVGESTEIEGASADRPTPAPRP